MGVHRTCGGPAGIELTPMGVKLNTRIHGAYISLSASVAIALAPVALQGSTPPASLSRIRMFNQSWVAVRSISFGSPHVRRARPHGGASYVCIVRVASRTKSRRTIPP